MIDSVKGAQASAAVYSIIETAKANHLKPYEYLKYLLTEMPKHMEDTDFSPGRSASVDRCNPGHSQKNAFLTLVPAALSAGDSFDSYGLFTVYRNWSGNIKVAGSQATSHEKSNIFSLPT